MEDDKTIPDWCDSILATYVRALGFRDELDWAEKRQIEHRGAKSFADLRSEFSALSWRYQYLAIDICYLIAREHAKKDDVPELLAKADHDVKAFLKDCEAWLSDARTAIPYNLGDDGRPLPKGDA